MQFLCIVFVAKIYFNLCNNFFAFFLFETQFQKLNLWGSKYYSIVSKTSKVLIHGLRRVLNNRERGWCAAKKALLSVFFLCTMSVKEPQKNSPNAYRETSCWHEAALHVSTPGERSLYRGNVLESKWGARKRPFLAEERKVSYLFSKGWIQERKVKKKK